jgi:glycosyltransferase involved in cell wall biosynthesis
MTMTVLDCSGVGDGGISRVLTELVRHWPAEHRLQLVAAPAAWEIPAHRAAAVEVVSRQASSRERTIAAATSAMRRVTTDAGPRTRVLSLSPSLAVVGSRLPVTTIVHDLAFKLWPQGLSRAVLQYRRVSYAAAIRRSARLLCVSARTRHDLLGLYGVGYERTQVWHPGSDLVEPGDLPAQLAQSRRHGAEYLVVAGHAPHKGVELAVEAVATQTRYLLVVLTGGNRIERFEAAAARSGAADRILFLDRLPDRAYAATIAQAAAFLMPSHFEGYGLPAAEALRLGTPTVISPDPALHEATGGAAIRMESWTADALSRAIERIDRSRPPAIVASRSWRAATEELVDRLTAPPVGDDLVDARGGH